MPKIITIKITEFTNNLRLRLANYMGVCKSVFGKCAGLADALVELADFSNFIVLKFLVRCLVYHGFN